MNGRLHEKMLGISLFLRQLPKELDQLLAELLTLVYSTVMNLDLVDIFKL